MASMEEIRDRRKRLEDELNTLDVELSELENEHARSLQIRSAPVPEVIQRQQEEARAVAVIDGPRFEEPPPRLISTAELCLDLGSGPRPADGFQGVDMVEGVTDHCLVLDNGTRWPWDNNSVSQLRSSHFIEHIRACEVPVYNREKQWSGNQDAFFFFFDEAYRIAKPGATFQLIWPDLQSERAFQDPTHRRFIPRMSLLYLDKAWRKQTGLDHYNVQCDWVTESVNPTIPITLSTKNEDALKKELAEKWNLAVDNVATMRARK